MEGLAGLFQYQLMSHTFPSFQHLLDKAIFLESKRRELGELKRKATTPRQSGSSTMFRPGGPTGGGGLWPAAVPVPTTAAPAVSALRPTVPAPKAADSTPVIPAEPSDDSSGHAREAQRTSHPRGKQLF
jgi:hypothetical protein